MKKFKDSKRSKEQELQKAVYRVSVKDRYSKRSKLSRIREDDQMNYYREGSKDE